MYALYTLLSLLPLSAYAIDGRPNGPPAKPAPTVPETFHWTNPWGEDVSPPIDLEPACDVIATYKLNQHLLYDVPIMPPLGFQPYAKHMKAFFGSAEYPGGWEGLDPHGSDRVLLAMNWTDVPNAVKEWVLENEAVYDSFWDRLGEKVEGGRKGRGLYSVYKRATGFEEEPDILPAHGVWEHDLFMVFSPGAIYEIAPLWVANEVKGECRDAFLDLSRYSSEWKDGGVLAWPVDHGPEPDRFKKERQIELAVQGQVLKKVVDDYPEGKDEL